MKPSRFKYHAPETIDEAVGLLGEFGDEAKPLAGGQSLVPLLALRMTSFGHLIDLNGIADLAGVGDSDEGVRIGSMTRQSEARAKFLGGFKSHAAGSSHSLDRAFPDPQSWHGRRVESRMPILPLSCPPSLSPWEPRSNAWVQTDTAVSRRLNSSSQRGQLHWILTNCSSEAHVPVWSGRTGCAIEEVARRHGDFTLVGVACIVEVDDDYLVNRAGIVLFGVGATPYRAVDAELALVGTRPGADLTHIGESAVADLDPPDDVHASSSYRRTVGAVLVERAVSRAMEEAHNG